VWKEKLTVLGIAFLLQVYALAALSDQADTAAFHIVRYHQAWMEDDRLYIQTELCTGTLSDEIARTGRPTELRRYKLLREICLALAFIHRNNMVHLDIKPDNIFLKNDQYKLGDFGLVSLSSASSDVEEGDSRYMSMELLSGDRSDLTKSDIFSLGATLYEICRFGGADGLPMNGPEWQDLRAGRLTLPLPETGPEMTHLVQRMMNPTFEQRPASSDLLKHPQLLSDEQKALNWERSKVAQANMQLNMQQFQRSMPPLRKGLVRANTWSGNLSVL
jgi:wee1-like protein kinase